jgi:hypothetical protein
MGDLKEKNHNHMVNDVTNQLQSYPRNNPFPFAVKTSQHSSASLSFFIYFFLKLSLCFYQT